MRGAGWLAALTLAVAVAVPLPAAARNAPQAAVADPALPLRAREIAALLAGRGSYAATFAPAFIAEVPPARFAAIAAQLQRVLGPPIGPGSVVAEGPYAATVTFRFAGGTATAQLLLDPGGAHRVTGLLVTGTALAHDDLTRLAADIRALPGAAGFGIYRLAADDDGGEPQPIAESHGNEAAPIGSVFKLWLLAEASRQVQTGERHWTDVVTVGPSSLPSGILQTWPAGSPVTLQTLATLMVSISDNTAADTMLTLVGRDQVGALATATRSADPRTLPLLSTREAFLLKGDPALTTAWASGDLPARQALLAAQASRMAAAPLSFAMYGAGRPLANDSVEWFASPLGLARLLDWLRRHGDPTTLAIMAVAPGTQADTAARFDYVGFKGGSEPGVASLAYLVRTRSGHWLAVTGSWHRPDADAPTERFAALMNRALALAAAQ